MLSVVQDSSYSVELSALGSRPSVAPLGRRTVSDSSALKNSFGSPVVSDCPSSGGWATNSSAVLCSTQRAFVSAYTAEVLVRMQRNRSITQTVHLSVFVQEPVRCYSIVFILLHKVFFSSVTVEIPLCL